MAIQFQILAIIIHQSDTNYTFTGQTSVVVNDRIYITQGTTEASLQLFGNPDRGNPCRI